MLRGKLQLICAMLIFGTIGIFVRYIPLPSSVIVFARGCIGALFLLPFLFLKKEGSSKVFTSKKFPLLLLSGAVLGGNWILLFEAYRYTTISTATACYYLAPMIVLLASPLVLGEKLTAKKILCVLAALGGAILVSGVIQGGLPSAKEGAGIVFGLGAAVLYAGVILLNRKLKDIPSYTKTTVQLVSAAFVVLPYILLTVDLSALKVTFSSGVGLFVVGVVHTGLAYLLYFRSFRVLPAQTAAIFSYIDPVAAIFLSALVLQEMPDLFGILGAVLILGSALISELPIGKKESPN